MNIVQSNQERMSGSVLDTLNSNNPIWANNPLFAQQVETHEGNLAEVRKWRDKQADLIMIKGLTRDKHILREITTDEAVRIIAAIKTLANATNNQSLFESVNYSPSKLMKLKENTFIASCMQVLAVANTNAAALVPYGVTAAMLTLFADDVDAFQDIYSKTRSKRVVVKGFTTNLAAAVRKMVSFLKNVVDYSIEQYVVSEPGFVNDYRVSRKIVNYGNTHTGIRGTITNKETGQKLRNIQVTIMEIGMNAYSNVRGVYSFGDVPFGKYTLRLHGTGYSITEIPNVQLHEGKMMDYDIELMPEHAPVPVPVN